MRAHLYARVSIYKLNYDVFIRAREFSSANTYVQIKRLPFFHVRRMFMIRDEEGFRANELSTNNINPSFLIRFWNPLECFGETNIFNVKKEIVIQLDEF